MGPLRKRTRTSPTAAPAERLGEGGAERGRLSATRGCRPLPSPRSCPRPALAAGDDRARVTHAAARAGRPAGDEADHRLLAALLGLLDSNSAASSSAEPPISPIMMMDLVSGSSRNMSSTSMNSVPLTGSPPMPTAVDWPRPALVVWITAS